MLACVYIYFIRSRVRSAATFVRSRLSLSYYISAFPHLVRGGDGRRQTGRVRTHHARLAVVRDDMDRNRIDMADCSSIARDAAVASDGDPTNNPPGHP